MNGGNALDLFPQAADLIPEPAPTTIDLQMQINDANMEMNHLRNRLRSLTAEMHASVEESVLVSEAHLEQRMEQLLVQFVEEMKLKVENDVDVRVKMEFGLVCAFVMVICLCAGVIARVFGPSV